MTYLAHTAHAQLCALGLSCVGWALTGVALGLIQWRVWLVSDTEVISSGVAWVGVWRTCFHSHTLVTPAFRVMHCSSISATEAFTPPEIVAAQVLMLLSLLVGLCGNAGGVYALRNIYFGREKNSTVCFFGAGALCLSAAVMSLVPLVWNLSSVVNNQTISFPSGFRMPPAPDSQHVGCGIGVGMVGTVLMMISAVTFCMYRLPVRSQPRMQQEQQPVASRGGDNPGFESHEHV